MLDSCWMFAISQSQVVDFFDQIRHPPDMSKTGVWNVVWKVDGIC